MNLFLILLPGDLEKMFKTAFATAALFTIARAGDDDDEWEMEFENEEREISLQMDGPEFEVEAESALGDELRLRGDLDTSDLIRYDVQYSSTATTLSTPASKSTHNEDYEDSEDSQDSQEGDEIETEFNLRFTSLFEYEESGTTLGYQPDEDTLTSEITEASWTNWELVQDCTSVSADCVFELSASSTYMSTTAYFTSAATTLSGNRTLSANAIKFDLGLMDYPYSGNNTYLAFAAEMYVEVEWDLEEEDNDDEDNNKLVLSSGADVGGYFTYVTNVDYTTNETTGTANVITTTASSGYEFYFAFDIVQPSTIKWDPEMGVQADVLAVNPAPVASHPLLAAACLMAYSLF